MLKGIQRNSYKEHAQNYFNFTHVLVHGPAMHRIGEHS